MVPIAEREAEIEIELYAVKQRNACRVGNHAAGIFVMYPAGMEENNIQMKASKDCDACKSAIFVN